MVDTHQQSADEGGVKLRPSPETQPSDPLVTLSADMRARLAHASSDRPEAASESPADAFKRLREDWYRLPPEERDSVNVLIDRLVDYFLEQQRQGTFTLKDAHSMIVRDFDRPEFHALLMSRIRERARVENVGEDMEQLGLLSEEFDANHMRRLGFHLIATNHERAPEGQQHVEQARRTFERLLREWEQRGDLKVQGRLLYELGHIAWELKDWPEAIRVQDASAHVAYQIHDEVGATIARIKVHQAGLNGNIGNVFDHAAELTELTAAMIRLADGGNRTAMRWVSNANIHLAEAALAVAEQSADNAEKHIGCMLLCNAVMPWRVTWVGIWLHSEKYAGLLILTQSVPKQPGLPSLRKYSDARVASQCQILPCCFNDQILVEN